MASDAVKPQDAQSKNYVAHGLCVACELMTTATSKISPLLCGITTVVFDMPNDAANQRQNRIHPDKTPRNITPSLPDRKMTAPGRM